MSARPILFNGAMVRALIDGRKTQTRRVVKPRPLYTEPGIWSWARGRLSAVWTAFALPAPGITSNCPYGRPGDLLWVRETWRPFAVDHNGVVTGHDYDLHIDYAAGGSQHVSEEAITDHVEWAGYWNMPKAAERGNVSPLFMPRFASRLTLRITSVRLERLQEIGEEDARAEGIELAAWEWGEVTIAKFSELWDSINAANGHGWEANPWVWVLSFDVVHANVDDVLREGETG